MMTAPEHSEPRVGDHLKHTVPRELRLKMRLPDHPIYQRRKAESGSPPGRVGRSDKEKPVARANRGLTPQIKLSALTGQ